MSFSFCGASILGGALYEKIKAPSAVVDQSNGYDSVRFAATSSYSFRCDLQKQRMRGKKSKSKQRTAQEGGTGERAKKKTIMLRKRHANRKKNMTKTHLFTTKAKTFNFNSHMISPDGNH